MLYYALFTYALMCAALTLGALSLLRIFLGAHLQPIARGIISACVFGLSLVSVKGVSISMLLYSVFDVPSFLLLFICFFSFLRTFINQIGFIISIRGFIFLGVVWFLFACNVFGIFEWVYGSVGYKIFLVACMLAFAYSIDRICGVFLLMACICWLPFSHVLDIYNALFDSIVALFGWAVQSIPLYRHNFHVALLKPKMKH